MEIQSMFFTLYGQFIAAACAFAILMVHVTRRQTLRLGDDAQAIEAIHKIDTLTLTLWCLPAGFIGARLLYCLFRFDFYWAEVGLAGILRTWEGGFLLYGAVLGVLVAAWILARVKGVSAALLMDELAAPGMMAIAIGRMAESMTSEGVGPWMENELFCRFPFAICNEYGEWQLAVFMFESIAAVVILMVLLRLRCGRGEKILTALLLYAGCQIVLESMRVDSCLRIGFVRVSQVISALVVLAITLIRALRVGKKQALVAGSICFGCIAVSGIIEWALDKTPINNVLLYAAMAAACAVIIGNAMRYMKREE